MDKLAALTEKIKKICPVDGLSGNGRIDFKGEASADERAAAQVIMDAYLTNPEAWEPTLSDDEVKESAMQKCEAHFSKCGYTPFRVIDLLSQLSNPETTTERRANIAHVQAWMQSCRDATLKDPNGLINGLILLERSPVKYSEI